MIIMKMLKPIRLLLLAGVVILSVSGCGKTVGRTTDTKSISFENVEEKIAFLEEYLITPSKVLDAEYHIVYHDNSTGMVPGPSDWEIRAALKVRSVDISLWTEGMKKVLPEQIDPEWWEDLKTETFTWPDWLEAEYYKAPDARSYLVAYPEHGMILKMVSTLYIPVIQKEYPDEEISGYEEYKSLVADILDYDHSAIPHIETVQAEKGLIDQNIEADIICYHAHFYDSRANIYGIPVLVIDTGEEVLCKILEDGSYRNKFLLADIDGDGYDEILLSHETDALGGAGNFTSAVYQLVDQKVETLFYHPDRESEEYFDTGFTLTLSDGYVHTISNRYTGYNTTFVRKRKDDRPYPYFDEAGNITEYAKENNEKNHLAVDSSFYQFQPVDINDDGIFEIMTAQYTSLWSRADGMGSAHTIMSWNQNTGTMDIIRAGFWPWDVVEDDNYENWHTYEDNWYTVNE